HGEFLLTNAMKMSKRAGAAGEGRDMGEGIEPLNKDTGGFLTLQKLVDQGYDPLAYRYFCFSAKYRAQLNYTDESMQAAAKALEGLYDFVWRAAEMGTTGPEPAKGGRLTMDGASSPEEWQQPFVEKFVASIND